MEDQNNHTQVGVLHKVFEAVEIGEKRFRKREFVVELKGKYPQFVTFQLTQDRCDIIDPYKVGDEIEVHFNLAGRAWNDKYFNTLTAWRIVRLSQEQLAPTLLQVSLPDPMVDRPKDDDLPF